MIRSLQKQLERERHQSRDLFLQNRVLQNRLDELRNRFEYEKEEWGE